MVYLNISYQSQQYIAAKKPENYAFGKVNGSIVADVDGNGFVDIVTFPSTHSLATGYEAIVWLNENGIFTPTHPKNPSNLRYEYIRNTAEGDFDGDGKLDFILADQGWELDGRTSMSGANPILLKGVDGGLEIKPLGSWIDGGLPSKTFYHVSGAADYDQDGDRDVAIAAFWNYRIFENNGDGTFGWQELNTKGIATDFGSGTCFIKLGDEYAIVVGHYRMFSPEDIKSPPVVFTQVDSKFVETMALSRPQLGGREQNYGAVDMYNIDINNDGREDLLMLWETEALGGIDDGKSVISGEVYYNGTRYPDITNTILTVWIQNDRGVLEPYKGLTHYNIIPEKTSGAELKFTDFNNDGYMDFYVLNYGHDIYKWNELIWLNDGKGGFSNPTETLFQVNKSEDLPDWYDPTPFFFDANNDGVTDVVTVRGVFDDSYFYRNIGEEVRVFLGNTDDQQLVTKVYGRYVDAKIFKADNEAYDIHTAAGIQHVANSLRVNFTDAHVALDTESANSAGGIYRLYQAAFDRQPDLPGLGYWINAADNGKSAVTMAEDFTWSKEFLDLFHLTTPKDNYFTGVDVKTLVEGMYTHVLHRAADSGGLNYYAGVIQSHEKTVGRVLAEISDSPENHTAVASAIANGIQYTPYIAQAMTSLHVIDDIDGVVAEPQTMTLDSYSTYSDQYQLDLIGQSHDLMIDWMWLG